MTFSPILRTDKVRASTFNLRFQEFEDRINNFNPSQDLLAGWTMLSSTQSSIEINDIPQSYPALLLLARAKCDINGFVKFNGDNTVGNYKHRRVNDLASPFAENLAAFRLASPDHSANGFATWRILIMNYTGAIANLLSKSVHADNVGLSEMMHNHGLYLNGPITSIELSGLSVFQVGTAYALYGLKS